jgi:hypothetical protein
LAPGGTQKPSLLHGRKKGVVRLIWQSVADRGRKKRSFSEQKYTLEDPSALLPTVETNLRQHGPKPPFPLHDSPPSGEKTRTDGRGTNADFNRKCGYAESTPKVRRKYAAAEPPGVGIAVEKGGEQLVPDVRPDEVPVRSPRGADAVGLPVPVWRGLASSVGIGSHPDGPDATWVSVGYPSADRGRSAEPREPPFRRAAVSATSGVACASRRRRRWASGRPG